MKELTPSARLTKEIEDETKYPQDKVVVSGVKQKLDVAKVNVELRPIEQMTPYAEGRMLAGNTETMDRIADRDNKTFLIPLAKGYGFPITVTKTRDDPKELEKSYKGPLPLIMEYEDQTKQKTLWLLGAVGTDGQRQLTEIKKPSGEPPAAISETITQNEYSSEAKEWDKAYRKWQNEQLVWSGYEVMLKEAQDSKFKSLLLLEDPVQNEKSEFIGSFPLKGTAVKPVMNDLLLKHTHIPPTDGMAVSAMLKIEKKTNEAQGTINFKLTYVDPFGAPPPAEFEACLENFKALQKESMKRQEAITYPIFYILSDSPPVLDSLKKQYFGEDKKIPLFIKYGSDVFVFGLDHMQQPCLNKLKPGTEIKNKIDELEFKKELTELQGRQQLSIIAQLQKPQKEGIPPKLHYHIYRFEKMTINVTRSEYGEKLDESDKIDKNDSKEVAEKKAKKKDDFFLEYSDKVIKEQTKGEKQYYKNRTEKKPDDKPIDWISKKTGNMPDYTMPITSKLQEKLNDAQKTNKTKQIEIAQTCEQLQPLPEGNNIANSTLVIDKIISLKNNTLFVIPCIKGDGCPVVIARTNKKPEDYIKSYQGPLPVIINCTEGGSDAKGVGTIWVLGADVGNTPARKLTQIKKEDVSDKVWDGYSALAQASETELKEFQIAVEGGTGCMIGQGQHLTTLMNDILKKHDHALDEENSKICGMFFINKTVSQKGQRSTVKIDITYHDKNGNPPPRIVKEYSDKLAEQYKKRFAVSHQCFLRLMPSEGEAKEMDTIYIKKGKTPFLLEYTIVGLDGKDRTGGITTEELIAIKGKDITEAEKESLGKLMALTEFKQEDIGKLSVSNITKITDARNHTSTLAISVTPLKETNVPLKKTNPTEDDKNNNMLNVANIFMTKGKVPVKKELTPSIKSESKPFFGFGSKPEGNTTLDWKQLKKNKEKSNLKTEKEQAQQNEGLAKRTRRKGVKEDLRTLKRTEGKINLFKENTPLSPDGKENLFNFDDELIGTEKKLEIPQKETTIDIVESPKVEKMQAQPIEKADALPIKKENKDTNIPQPQKPESKKTFGPPAAGMQKREEVTLQNVNYQEVVNCLIDSKKFTSHQTIGAAGNTTEFTHPNLGKMNVKKNMDNNSVTMGCLAGKNNEEALLAGLIEVITKHNNIPIVVKNKTEHEIASKAIGAVAGATNPIKGWSPELTNKEELTSGIAFKR